MDTIEDKELDEILEQRKEAKELAKVEEKQHEVVQPKFEQTNFGKKMDDVKQTILAEAAANDDEFVTTVKENLKDAAITATEVEQEKQKLEKQQVNAEQEKLGRTQKQIEHGVAEDKWLNRQKRRQYHYDGVKPIMDFVGIESPMNEVVLYLITVLIFPIFFLDKMFKGTIGALLFGACDGNRPKQMRGFMWTMLGILMVVVVIAIICGLLVAFGVDVFAGIK